MRKTTLNASAVICLTSVVIATSLLLGLPVWAQEGGEVFTANAIPSETTVGNMGGRVVIRVVSYTSDAEKAKLVEAFKKDPATGLALLRTMSKGYLNVEGQSGRKIEAAFVRQRQDGTELILIGEHMLTKLEQSRGVKVEDHPLAVIHLRFGTDGKPVSGEAFPAVKLTITEDGFPDVKTDDSNHVTLINVARR